MASSRHFAVLQKDAVATEPEQLKRAFRTFSNLTDADAIRVAVGAHGILMRHLGQDEARAFQRALQTEGVRAAVVAESQLPKLPDARTLNRLELSPEGLVIFNLMGRPNVIPWANLALLAAGAVRHVELGRTQNERTEARYSAMLGAGSKQSADSTRKVHSSSQLLLELLLADGTTRYQIEAARFPFNYVIDQPSLSTAGKFIWLVRELCQRAPNAVLNGGARWLRAGHEPVPGYLNRQAMADEMIWLLWQNTQGSPAKNT